MVEAGKCILVTGANVGIGFDCARQLGLMDIVGKVIITCRSAEKGAASKQRLEQLTKRDIFEVVTMDLSDLSTVEAALAVLRKEPAIDGAVLNAGGAGGAEPKALTADGVTNSVAVNVLGHVLLVDRLIKACVLGPGASVVFSGSESARGLRAGPPPAWSPKPVLKTGSIEEFKSICDGTFFLEEVQHMSIVQVARCPREAPRHLLDGVDGAAAPGDALCHHQPWRHQRHRGSAGLAAQQAALRGVPHAAARLLQRRPLGGCRRAAIHRCLV